MYLIDTSIWIDYLREKKNIGIEKFVHILDNNLPFGITSTIYQEILQGAETVQDFNKLSTYLNTQIFFHPKDNLLTYQAAAKIYFDCRRKGLTIRSTIDCLIAKIAIEHELFLLHNDNDFVHIKKIVPQLKLA